MSWETSAAGVAFEANRTYRDAVQSDVDGLVQDIKYEIWKIAAELDQVNPESLVSGFVVQAIDLPPQVDFDPQGNRPSPHVNFSDVGTVVLADAPEPAQYVPGNLGSIQAYSEPSIPSLMSIDTPALFEFEVPPSPGSTPALYSVEAVDLSDDSVPSPPDLGTIVINVPTAFDIAPLETFAYTVDPFDGELPDTVLRYSEGTYVPTQLYEKLLTVLAADVENGGLALPSEAEQAIYDSAISRDLAASRQMLNETIDIFAASGFPQPTGALRARMRVITQDLIDRSDAINRDIMVKQVQLSNENRKFAVEKGVQIEAMLTDFYHKCADRTLQAAIATSDLAVKVYNMKVAQYTQALEMFKARLGEFEIKARVRAQEIEIQRLGLEAAKVGGELRNLEIQKYLGELQAFESGIKRDTVRLNQVALKLEENKYRLDAYRASVDVYQTSIAIKQAEAQIYNAQLTGEEHKLKMNQAQVELYRAQIESKKASVDAEKEVLLGKIEVEKGKIKQAEISLEIYKTKAEVGTKVASAAIEQFKAENESWQNELQRAKAAAEVAVLSAKSQAEIAKFNATEQAMITKAKVDALTSLYGTKMEHKGDGLEAFVEIAKGAQSQISIVSQSLGAVNADETIPVV